VIKSSYEEEWSYFANGTLERAEPLNGRRLTYTWDGEVLQPLRAKGTDDDDGGPSLGTGRWNGVWLSWYRGDYLSEDPVIQYVIFGSLCRAYRCTRVLMRELDACD
jgi:hypothetical protein